MSQVITDGKYFVAENFLLLTLVSPQIDEGTYYCNLTSSAGTVTSDSVYVDVLSELKMVLIVIAYLKGGRTYHG